MELQRQVQSAEPTLTKGFDKHAKEADEEELIFRRGTIFTSAIPNIETQFATRNSNSNEESSEEQEVALQANVQSEEPIIDQVVKLDKEIDELTLETKNKKSSSIKLEETPHIKYSQNRQADNGRM